MQHPIMEYLEDSNSSISLLEELQEQVNCGMMDEARLTAAKIEAIKTIKFDLLKLIKEDESNSS